MSPLYVIGILVIASQLVWQVRCFHLERPEVNFRQFRANIMMANLLAATALLGPSEAPRNAAAGLNTCAGRCEPAALAAGHGAFATVSLTFSSPLPPNRAGYVQGGYVRARGRFKVTAALVCAALGLAGCGRSGPAADVGRGQALARSLGCADCHGPALTGQKVSHNDRIAILYSANLTRAAPAYSDAQLRAVLTTGQRLDGTRLWEMDAAPYAVLSERDMGDLIAYLRSLEPTGEIHPRIKTTPAFETMVREGQIYPQSRTLAEDLAHPPASVGADFERGRYLARTACAGCHAPSLRGFQPPQAGDPPDLAVVGGYSRPEFQTLLRTGKGKEGRDVGEMSEAARKRFSSLSAADVDALYGYLSTWARQRPD